MTRLSRRDALKAIGIGAPAARLIAEKMKHDMVISAGMGVRPSVTEDSPSSSSPLRLTSFAEWLKLGHDRLKEEADQISSFDGDIIDMRLPMMTKCRMQRARNYARLVNKRKRWFTKTLAANGAVSWWPS